jgi:hypothetical protein
MNNRIVRIAAILVIALAAVVGAVQLSADTAEAYSCDDSMNSCLAWCARGGANIYGSFGACRNACRSIFCR